MPPLAESGDVIAAGERLQGEIGAVAGGATVGRLDQREVTIFKSVGVAVEDVVSADLVWRRLTALGG